MKLSPLQLSLAVSVGVHALAAGILSWTGVFRSAPSAEHEPLVTLELIAAPELAAETVTPPAFPSPPKAAPVVPPTPIVQPPVPEPEIVLLPSPVAPEPPPVSGVPQPKPLAPVPAPVPVKVVPVPPNPPPVVARGDGSSSQPGRDATTQPAPRIEAKANYKKNPEPVYPAQAKARRLQGTVILAVRVSAAGRATEVTIKQSSGYSLLDEAALKAVRDWDFEPARVGALAVESQIEVPVRFKWAQ